MLNGDEERGTRNDLSTVSLCYHPFENVLSKMIAQGTQSKHLLYELFE